MQENKTDGFDVVLKEIDLSVPTIAIGGVQYMIRPANRIVDDQAFVFGAAFQRTNLVAAENDGDPWKAASKEDMETTQNLIRVTGFRIQNMRDYRIFYNVWTQKEIWRAVKSILNMDGTEYADEDVKIGKVYKALMFRPDLFEQINTAAGWPDFDSKIVKLAAKAKKEAPKEGPKLEDEAPNE